MTIPATGKHTFSDQWTQGDTTHYHACTTTNCTAKSNEAAHTYNWTTKDANGHSGKCSECQKEITSAAHDFDYKSLTATTHVKYCKICGYEEAATAHDFTTNNGTCACGATNPATTGTLTVTQSSLPSNTASAGQVFSVTPNVKAGTADVTAYCIFYYSWTLDGYSVASYNNTFTLPTGTAMGNHKLVCTVTPYYNNAAITGQAKSVSWSFSVKNTANVSVTVSQNQGNFYFTDNTTQEGTSIYDQIVTALGYNYNNYNNYYVTITGSGTVGTLTGAYTNIPLSNLGNVYLALNNTSGTWKGSFSVYAYTGTATATTEVLSGSITINVQPYTGTGIIYSATLGEEVALRVSDFENFWSEVTSGRGTLSSVTINSVSTGTVGGTLCYHTAGERNHTSAANQTFYVSPRTSTQRDLSNLTFFPGSTSNRYRTGTVTISFTATGTNYSTTSYNSSYNTSASGTITILYTNGAVEAINYAATSSYTVLDADDFNAVYRQATATTTTSPTYTVRFLDVPTYGTLYANYSVNSRTGAITGTEITSRNVNTLSFSNRTTGTNSLEKVAYVPGYRGVGDSVRYAVYSNNTLVYVGTVNFGVGTLSVTYACGASGVSFKAADFFSSSSSLLTSQYITFGTPSSGTLYKSGSARVTTSDRFGYTASAAAGVQSISTVTYVPVSGYNGVVEIPFTSVSYTGGTISGTVKITVTTKTFTDVPATHWAYSYINRLVGEGVVDGVTPTTYAPSSNVKYGEALKMILIAAGYPAQTEGTGANWASNYLALAYRNGIVSSTSGDLNAAVDRNTIASITAKALKISQASSINRGIIAPTDSRDGYVYALYNVGILNGTTTNGVNRFNGSSSLTRAELAAIVCRVSDYYSANNK